MKRRSGALRLVEREASVSLEASLRPGGPAPEDSWVPSETRSYGFDPDQMGQSTRPTGEIAYPLLPIPISPTTAPELRYLYRVATMAVGREEIALLTAVETVVQIGSVPAVIPIAGFAPVNLTVRDPFWHFADGNVTFALRYLPGPPEGGGGGLGGTFDSVSDAFYGQGSALLGPAGYLPDYLPGLVGHAYAPPNNGQPVGVEMGDLGYLETLRFLRRERSEAALLAPPQRGPGQIVMYASVAQTDPLTRPPIVMNVPADLGALGPEDRFVLGLPNVIYRKLGGAFRADRLGISCAEALYGQALRGEVPGRYLALGKVL